MPDVVCSLKTEIPQSIPPSSSAYTLLRFPYGDSESWDPCDMHPVMQPDGVVSTYPDPRSGLIWPAHDGAFAHIYALIYWEDGDYTEVRSRIVRDPLGLVGAPDSTCTSDHPATLGGQYRPKSWGMFVHVGVPLGLMVRHNAPSPVKVTLAEFKIAYHLDPIVPTP